ncbi:MAG: 30S ribosomal protein S14 [Chlamydiia bacterium]
MARKALIAKEKRREQLVDRLWDKRQGLKKTSRDMNLTEEDRQAARDALNSMPRDSCPVRLRNRCQVTGRARGFLRKFQLSRITFREMANAGLIPGIFKASW